jgi:2-keto-4-pentenoate hydratase/2-oxohepta-3-ene-1,7-dioic acid hydratase in catechol pathway
MVRLVQFVTSESDDVRVGVEVPELKAVVDLNQALKKPHLTMRQFLELGNEGLRKAKALAEGAKKAGKFTKSVIATSAVTFKAPITDPEKIICIGMNYVDHCTEQNYPIPTEPIIFSKFNSAISADGDDIIFEETEKLDFEVELVIVVGQKGRYIKKEEASEYIAGYTVAHDVSARDWQLEKNGKQWVLGKTIDGYCPLGPAIVTKDDIKNPYNLGIRTILNGKPVQDGNTKEIIFKGEDLVAYCSRFFTLAPGDIILTGTPPGVGVFRKPPLFLKPGDVVKVEIDEIGAITNTVRERRSKL